MTPMKSRWIMRMGCLIVLTLVFLAIYGAGQQVLRMSANEPQTWLAESLASRIDAGQSPDLAAVAPQQTGEIGAQLRPFAVMYDNNGRPTAATATLGGKLPVIPVGVLKHADNRPYYAITWQPTSSQRFASVSVKTNTGYVMVARSLHDVEHREDVLLVQLATGWVITLAVPGAVLFFHHRLSPKSE